MVRKLFQKRACGILCGIVFMATLTGCTDISGYAEARQNPDNWESYEVYDRIVNGNESSGGIAETEEGIEQTDGTDGEMEIHYLDVGQGACTLFLKDDVSILVDGGDSDTSSYVVSYLQNTLGLSDIDVIVSTHYDSDHISGIIGCLNAYQNNISTVFDPDYVSDTRTYNSYVSALEESGAAHIHPSAGEVYEVDDIYLSFVGPVGSYEGDNDNSLVVNVDYKDTEFLIAGDAEQESIADMLAYDASLLDADVYLLSHHGSYTGYSEEFLDAITPSIAVVQCKRGNSYGHPHEEPMQYLQKHNIPLFRTDMQGTVVLYSDGKEISAGITESKDYSDG